jgi:hypothetical protein
VAEIGPTKHPTLIVGRRAVARELAEADHDGERRRQTSYRCEFLRSATHRVIPNKSRFILATESRGFVDDWQQTSVEFAENE